MDEHLIWVENLGDSRLNIGHFKDGSVIIVDGFESVCIEEEHLDVVIDHLQKIRDSKRRDLDVKDNVRSEHPSEQEVAHPETMDG